MPINFVTGLPRAGKTLWTLTQVKARAEKENRAVYYCNIPGVTIPGWIELDHPDKWLELPDGALIVVDELQDYWGKNAQGARVPLPILELSKHGKRGFDFYFITQEPNLVHTTPRDLCAYHYYVVRAFGANGAAVYKFERMQSRPDKVKSKGEKFPWLYNKQAFTWYKSADVHNIKRQIPKKVLAIPFVLGLAVLAIWGAFQFFGSTLDKAKGSKPASSNVFGGAVAQGGGAGQQQQARAPLTAAEYVASYRPRVEGLIHTAPAYDQLTAPKRVPVPAACIEMPSKGCKCFTQDATPYPTSAELCRQVVRSGLFLAFLDHPAPQPSTQSEKAPGGPPGASAAPGLLVMSDAGAH